MLELEIGIVKFFDDRPGKRFGFLTVLDDDGQPTGVELFFHFNGGQFVEFIDDENGYPSDIDFIGRRFPNGTMISPPEVGDRLAFEWGENKKGPMVARWTHAQAYENRVKQLTEPSYRLILVGRAYGGNPAFRKLYDFGKAFELDERYPVRVLRGRLDDPLEPHKLESFEFERERSPGSWETASDPRIFSERARQLLNERDGVLTQ